MKEDKIEWDSDKGKYVKKYAMWDSKKEDYYYDSPKGIMITIKAPRINKKINVGDKVDWDTLDDNIFDKWRHKIIKRIKLIKLLNKIPYVNARMIE